MTSILQLNPTIDVYVKGKGWAKALFLLDYGEQVNSQWKVRLYESGLVLNAYDDEVIVAANRADGETDQIPEDWKPAPQKLKSDID